MKKHNPSAFLRSPVSFSAVIGVVLTLWAPALEAQQAPDLKKVLYSMANSLGMLRTVNELDSVMTVEAWGRGTMREVGAKGIGPEVQIKSFYAQIAYDFPGMRVEIVRADGQREIQVVSGMHAWNEIDKLGGGLEPGWGSAVPAMDRVTERLLSLWMTPFGVVKAAMAAGDKTKAGVENGATVVTFPLVNGKPETTSYLVVGELAGAPVKVTLDANSRPARVELRFQNRTYLTTFDKYGDLNEADYRADIFVPARVVRTVDGQTVLDLTIDKTNTYNPYVIMPVPANVQKAPAR
jgi:hypothetical protein